MNDAPDYITPIVAYRGWQLHDNKLWSVSRAETWPPGEAKEAACNGPWLPIENYRINLEADPMLSRIHVSFTLVGKLEETSEHLSDGITLNYVNGALFFRKAKAEEPPPPHPKPHQCGLYALDNLDSVPGQVVGAVELTGKVIPGERGWRAQKARIIALLYPTFWSAFSLIVLDRASEREVRKIAEVYEVPVLKKLPEATKMKEQA